VGLAFLDRATTSSALHVDGLALALGLLLPLGDVDELGEPLGLVDADGDKLALGLVDDMRPATLTPST
jgi:hypothetical protein